MPRAHELRDPMVKMTVQAGSSHRFESWPSRLQYLLLFSGRRTNNWGCRAHLTKCRRQMNYIKEVTKLSRLSFLNISAGQHWRGMSITFPNVFKKSLPMRTGNGLRHLCPRHLPPNLCLPKSCSVDVQLNAHQV